MTLAGKTGQQTTWPEALLASVRNLPPHSGLYIALSGGLDSVLLLHTVARLLGGTDNLTALHVNHQLQPNAAETEAFCQRLCKSLALPCRTIRVEVATVDSDQTAGTGGLEEAAREARYQAFKTCLSKNDLLLMAHHGDDQAETVLFRLLRGTGVAGLGGMPVSRVLGEGRLYRPFLDFSRQELETWAGAQGLHWIEDPSNQDQRFDRNFLRQSILPALRARWPFLNRRLAATASACRESDELARSLASIHHALCRNSDGALNLSRLAELTLAEQKNLIRWWVRQQRCLSPNPTDWHGLLSEFLDAGDDRQPEYYGNGYVIRRHQNALYLDTGQCVPGENGARLLPGQKTVWGSWRIGLLAAGPSSQSVPELQVFARQGGERIRVRDDGPSKPLKNWLQEKTVPSWERARLPLVMDLGGGGEKLIAVGDLWVSEQYSGREPSSGWRLIMDRDSD